MKHAASLLVGAALMAGPAWAQDASPSYKPPVMRDDRRRISVWFGQVLKTGKWCAFDRKTFDRESNRDRLAPNISGWARYGAKGLTSVTLFQTSEDAGSEDHFFVDAGAVTKMIRTGGYIQDPSVSVTFEPDKRGRLRLTAASTIVVKQMNKAGYDPYFVDWPHASRLSQLPFAKLLDLKTAPRPGDCG